MMSRPVIGISMNFMKLGQYEQFHIRDKYIDAVYDNGGLPLPLPCFSDAEIISQYVSKADAVIIIGGMDYPPDLYGQNPHPQADIMTRRRAESDLLLFAEVMKQKKPLLGICAGLQLMNIATGGSLIQHLVNTVYHQGEKYHPISIYPSRWLPEIFGTDRIIVNSNHHQGIDDNAIGKGFSVVARADDGQIEAIEYDCEHFVLGIQWHPERISCSAEYAKAYTAEHDIQKQIAEHRNTLFSFIINHVMLNTIPY
jgi:putative glutamine amidotransferase